LGEDVRTVAAVLRIRPEHLEALEEGATDKLPGRTYALGFLRSYADYLGLDADEAVARFKEETAPEQKVETTSELVFPDAQDEVRIPQGSILIVGGLLLLGIWGGYYLSQSAHRLLSEGEKQPAQTSEATSASTQAPGARAQPLWKRPRRPRCPQRPRPPIRPQHLQRLRPPHRRPMPRRAFSAPTIPPRESRSKPCATCGCASTTPLPAPC
jgi:cytoskeletal protein RodZ